MKPQSAIQKGKDLENHVAKRLRDLGIDIRADRQGGSGNGLRKGDIVTDTGITFECKNTHNFNWKSTADQVRKASLGYNKEVIVWHPPQRPLADSIAVVPLEDYLELLKSKHDHRDSETILDKYTIKSNLEKAVHYLKRVIKEV